MNAIVVVQCRFASRRLPGKALYPFCGLPMLAFLLGRLAEGGLGEQLCLATTGNPEDDPVAAWGQACGAEVVRGPEHDVLGRYLLCLDRLSPKGVVRVTADNPLTCPDAVRLAMAGLEQGHAYVDVFEELPKGTGVDAFSTGALRRLARECTDPAEREHLNLRPLRCPEDYGRFRPALPAAWRRPDLNLSVDTPEDYLRVRHLAEQGFGGRPPLGLEDVVAGSDRHTL